MRHQGLSYPPFCIDLEASPRAWNEADARYVRSSRTPLTPTADQQEEAMGRVADDGAGSVLIELSSRHLSVATGRWPPIGPVDDRSRWRALVQWRRRFDRAA